jgi:hypothetical protein
MQSSSIEIPFRVLKPDHLIIIRGLVNGEGPFNFILDTGASMTVITPAVARAAGIMKGGRKAKAIGAKGSLDAKIVRLKSIRLGSLDTKSISAAIVNLATLSEPIKLDLGGIIGYNLLCRYRITIDYRTRTISFEG